MPIQREGRENEGERVRERGRGIEEIREGVCKEMELGKGGTGEKENHERAVSNKQGAVVEEGAGRLVKESVKGL